MDIKQAIEEYQCPGCVAGCDIKCEAFAQDNSNNRECTGHVAGTYVSDIGKILLGMPKGFNRLGCVLYGKEVPQLHLFASYKIFEQTWKNYNRFNRPVWKYLDKNGNTLVRGIMPRINHPFIHVILGNNLDKIDCLEITEKDIEEMD